MLVLFQKMLEERREGRGRERQQLFNDLSSLSCPLIHCSDKDPNLIHRYLWKPKLSCLLS